MTTADLAPYAPRPMAPAGLLEVAGHRLKLHAIHLPDRPAPDEAAWAAARSVAGRVVPEAAAREGGSHGLGFALLHEGTAGTWLLLHWWAHGDILCQRLLRADPGSTNFVPQDGRPLVACVWELAVIEHERRAWVRAMLTGAPDGAAYLADVLPAGAR